MSEYTFGLGRGAISPDVEKRIHEIATRHNVRFVYPDTGDVSEDSNFWFEMSMDPEAEGSPAARAAGMFIAAIKRDTELHSTLRTKTDVFDLDESEG